MKKRQVATVGIVIMLIIAVFFLTAIVSSDKQVKFSFIVPIAMSRPFLVIGLLLLYFSGGRKG